MSAFIHWRDWLVLLDWVVAVATIAAVCFAAAAIKVATGVARKDAARARVERRADFELGLLKELADLNALDPSGGKKAREMKTRLGLLPDVRDVAIGRATWSMPSTPEADRRISELNAYRTANAEQALLNTRDVVLRGEIDAEIVEAIQRRLDLRDPDARDNAGWPSRVLRWARRWGVGPCPETPMG